MHSRPLRLLAAILAAGLGGQAGAVTCTWLGVDGSAKNPANWTCPGRPGGLPVDGDDVLFPAAAATKTIDYDFLPTSPALVDVRFAEGYAVQGASDLVFSGQLVSAGGLALDVDVNGSGSGDVLVDRSIHGDPVRLPGIGGVRRIVVADSGLGTAEVLLGDSDGTGPDVVVATGGRFWLSQQLTGGSRIAAGDGIRSGIGSGIGDVTVEAGGTYVHGCAPTLDGPGGCGYGFVRSLALATGATFELRVRPIPNENHPLSIEGGALHLGGATLSIRRWDAADLHPMPGDAVAAIDHHLAGSVDGGFVDLGGGTLAEGAIVAAADDPAALFRLEYAGVGDPSQPVGASVVLTRVAAEATLDVAITGAGRVVSTPAGIDCPGACSASFPTGATVTLAQAPAAGRGFGGWGGACSGLEATCTLAMDAPRNVSADFPSAAAIAIVGGAVQTAPVGTAFAQPLAVEVRTSAGTPVAGALVRFTVAEAGGAGATLDVADVPTGADGRAAAHATANAVVGGPYAVTASVQGATFPPASFALSNVAAPAPVVLTVTRSGAGSGLVGGPGIACGGDCIETMPVGTEVTLVAQADAGSVFAGWSGGGCSGGGGDCTVVMAAATTVDARFDPVPVVAPPADPVPALDALGLLALVLGATAIAWALQERRA